MLPERLRLYRYLLLASPLAVLPAIPLYGTIADLQGFVPGPGVVVEHRCEPARTAIRLCRSRIEFQGVDGKTYSRWVEGATSWAESIGKPVDMLRSPHAPGYAVRAGLSGVWGGPAILMLLGWGVFLSVLVGTVLAVRTQKRRVLRLAQRKLERNARAREARRLRRESQVEPQA